MIFNNACKSVFKFNKIKVYNENVNKIKKKWNNGLTQFKKYSEVISLK